MSRTVRRAILTALSCAALVVCAAGCGSQGTVQAAPKTVVGTLPKPTVEPETPAFKLNGDAKAGKGIFAKAGCGGCHTLADAGTTGTVGPNLDQGHPDYRLATARVTLGKSPMPAFKGQLTDQQIADVATYVVTATGGKAPGQTGDSQ
jgi:mono/diheme cytochrome c family protein